jgi:hypothetical protein
MTYSPWRGERARRVATSDEPAGSDKSAEADTLPIADSDMLPCPACVPVSGEEREQPPTVAATRSNPESGRMIIAREKRGMVSSR